MALVRIGISPILSRMPYAVSTSVKIKEDYGYGDCVQNLHVSGVQRYPEVPSLPLPTNVSEIFANETGRFTPERARDIAAPIALFGGNQLDRSNFPIIRDDTHVESYDWSGAISLNGSMQSNVPKPFCSSGKSTHLNMPGGQWAGDSKYIAEDMQKSNYGCQLTHLPPIKKTNGYAILNGNNSLRRTSYLNHICRMNYSVTSNEQEKPNNPTELKKLSRKEFIKKYTLSMGKYFIFVHIGVSLTSLALCYTAVKSGMDMMPYLNEWLDMLELREDYTKLIKESKDFAIAYFIHKILFPFRLATTLFILPLVTTHIIGKKYFVIGKLSPYLTKAPVHPKLKKNKEFEVHTNVKAINESSNQKVKEIKDR